MHRFRVFEEQARQSGISIASITTGGCSDGNFSSALGIPTIDGMGPIGANFHH
jgi:glutamate carboxypeptidase